MVSVGAKHFLPVLSSFRVVERFCSQNLYKGSKNSVLNQIFFGFLQC
jgi:hypothetical protein